MGLYEHTLIAKQDLSTPDLENLENKYKELINKKKLYYENLDMNNFVNKLLSQLNYRGFFCSIM